MLLGLARVSGWSMAPTLRDGDRLLVRYDARPATGDVVVVRLPGGRPLAVKRAVRHEGGGWWVQRDNPVAGVDSWQVGAIPDEDVLAVALARVWPWPRLLRRLRGDRPAVGD